MDKQIKGRKRKKARWYVVLLALLLIAVSFLGFVRLGTVVRGNERSHWVPDYDKVDILPVLQKDGRTDEEYALLYAQTGLTRLGIDDLIERKEYDRILDIQECYFTDYEIQTIEFEPFTYTQYIDGFSELCFLQEGDIILCPSIYLSWFRYGHSAIVVNSALNTVVDAVEIGKNSALNSARQFQHYAQFMVLRPKADKETRLEAAQYARDKLVGLPYMMTAGILVPKDVKELKGTHCSHLVWYAYKQVGLDIDSTGGMIVTPQDIANSDELELVQNFGFHPERLWS